ncbi:MAG: hypothetical protein EOP49_30760, partial [Sphingobacteriales bacterium]
MRYPRILVFIGVTLFFLLSRYLVFYGFNGADDLHYGMLAARMLQGAYNPFEVNDIFSGRVLLISLQAMIYKLGGISVFTTALGSITAAIVACWLTIFKLLDTRNPVSVLLATSLFYGNPAVSHATTGILPDAYILLIGTIILVILKKDFAQIPSPATIPLAEQRPPGAWQPNAFIVGLLIAASLLIKEVIIVFLPFVILFVFTIRAKKALAYSLNMIAAFSLVIAVFALIYFLFTGDPFFRITQIRNGTYANACNFDLRPARDLWIRLTYGIWQYFILSGFYPVVLAVAGGIAICIQSAGTKIKHSSEPERPQAVYHKYMWMSFAIMLLLAIYFPFSLNGYQPLCADSRQFLFIVPFAVIAFINFYESTFRTRRNLLVVACCLLLLLP